MRVLKVVPTFYPAVWHGGPIFSVYGLCNAVVARGVELRVLTTTRSDRRAVIGPGFPARAPAGYPVYYCNRRFGVSVAPTLPWHLMGLARWADVVHLTAVYSFPTLPTLLLCKALGRPVVWSPRGSLQRWEGSTKPRLKAVWESMCKLSAPRGLILHVTSEEEAKESAERFPGLSVTVVPNGVDVPDELTRIEDDGSLRLLYIGRLHPKKGIENLLEACRILDGTLDVPWSLRLAGSGDRGYTKVIRTSIREASLSGRVSMLGDVLGEAKRELFERTDVLVFPSHTENFGMVVAEALAHGVPVIASRGTPWQRLKEEGCGLWVENSPAELAGAIQRISRMPLREMGRRGREWMLGEFDWHRRAGQMVTCYEEAMALGGAGRHRKVTEGPHIETVRKQ